MTKTRYLLVAIGVGVVVFACLNLYDLIPLHQKPTLDRPAQSAKLLRSTAATQTWRPSHQTIKHNAPTSLPADASLIDAVQVLTRNVDGGDVFSGMELTRRLQACSKSGAARSVAEDFFDMQTIHDGHSDANAGLSVQESKLQNAEERVRARKATRDECAQLPPELLKEWLKPLELAAQAGDPEAMREYARVALQDFVDVESVIANPNEAIERRDKARSYLLRAVDSGDLDALKQLSYSYFPRDDGSTRLFEQDPFRSYAYAYAATLGNYFGSNGELDWIMSSDAQVLDPQQLSNARTLGAQIYATCCSHL